VGKFITTILHEKGQQISLFGRRWLREDALDYDDGEDDGESAAELNRSADGDADENPPEEAKEDLLDEDTSELELMQAEFATMLRRHRARMAKGAGVDAKPGGAVVAGQGIGGPGGKVSRESCQRWMRRLRGERSLTESRAAARRARSWMARLLG
jgi:hypothetical protein